MEWWNVCVKCTLLSALLSRISFIFYSQHNSMLHQKHGGTETSEQQEAKRQMQRGTFGIFSSTDCTAATASSLHCWQSPGLFLHSHSVSLHTPTQHHVEWFFPRAGRQQPSGNPSFLSMYCMVGTGFSLSRRHLQGWKPRSAQGTAPPGSQASFCKAERLFLHSAFI